MSDVPLRAAREELAYLSAAGDAVRNEAVEVGTPGPAPEYLSARSVTLADGTTARQLLTGDRDRESGYQRLDNEILAGIRLARIAPSGAYPPEVSRLLGYEPSSAAPFALLEPYRGDAIAEVGRRMLPDDQRRFQVSLLAGLCWLAAAGVVHRALGPSAVLWDGQRVQITDFSRATVVGAPREDIGEPPWAAPEQRRGQVAGLASHRDDVWAAGQLIHFVRTGQLPADPGQLAGGPDLEALLAGVFGPAEDRPSARCLLTERLRQASPVPDYPDVDPLERGRQRFAELRARKHPGASPAGGAAALPRPGQQGPPADRDHKPDGAGDGVAARATGSGPSARRRFRLMGGLTAMLSPVPLLIR